MEERKEDCLVCGRLAPETAAKREAANAPMDAEDPGDMRCSFAEKAREQFDGRLCYH